MKKKLLLIILAAAAAVSCYKEDPISAEKGTPQYVIEDSSDPALHYLYELNRNTGVYTLYDFSEIDYSWDVSATSKNDLVLMDPTLISEAVDYARTILFDNYNEEFISRYFPMKVFLAGSVNHASYSVDVLTDRACGYGRSYLALGRIRQDAFPKTTAQLVEAKGKVNGMLWGDIIYRNSLIEIPAGFFSAAADWYGASAAREADRNEEDFTKNLGIWSFDETNQANDYMFPTQAGDVSDFVEMITSHTAAEMQALMSGYENLVIKYNILINAVEKACGINLQDIGDNKPQGVDPVTDPDSGAADTPAE